MCKLALTWSITEPLTCIVTNCHLFLICWLFKLIKYSPTFTPGFAIVTFHHLACLCKPSNFRTNNFFLNKTSNLTFHHGLFAIRTHHYLYPRQFCNPNILKHFVKFSFNLGFFWLWNNRVKIKWNRFFNTNSNAWGRNISYKQGFATNIL